MRDKIKFKIASLTNYLGIGSLDRPKLVRGRRIKVTDQADCDSTHNRIRKVAGVATGRRVGAVLVNPGRG